MTNYEYLDEYDNQELQELLDAVTILDDSGLLGLVGAIDPNLKKELEKRIKQD